MQAHQEGRITSAELIDQMAQAEAASSSAELAKLTSSELTIRDSHQADDNAYLPATTSEPMRVTALLGSRTVLSPVLPPVVEINAVMGEIKLDLRGARFSAQETIINFQVGMAEVKILVDEGVNVIDDLTQVLADYKAKRLSPSADGPRIRLRGFAAMCEVKVYGPGGQSLLDKAADYF